MVSLRSIVNLGRDVRASCPCRLPMPEESHNRAIPGGVHDRERFADRYTTQFTVTDLRRRIVKLRLSQRQPDVLTANAHLAFAL